VKIKWFIARNSRCSKKRNALSSVKQTQGRHKLHLRISKIKLKPKIEILR
jgi:hypothetical protein